MSKLIAKERFYYNGRNVEAGEEFEAVEQDVGLLTNSVSPRARLPEVVQEAEGAAKNRRRYQRRDLLAQE